MGKHCKKFQISSVHGACSADGGCEIGDGMHTAHCNPENRIDKTVKTVNRYKERGNEQICGKWFGLSLCIAFPEL